MVQPQSNGSLLVAEVNWSKLTKAEASHLRDRLRLRFERSALANNWPKARFEVIDQGELGELP